MLTMLMMMDTDASWLCRPQRPEQPQTAGLSTHQIDIFLDAMAKLVEPVPIHFRWQPQLRDPGDELVLEAAVNAGADVLLSFNQMQCSPVF
jgi:predicted nucleic acid-binding protein